MPKINVYLPDELAEAVKASGVPVSAICQRALEQAVRRVTAIRATVLSDLDLEQPTGALTHLTPRTRTVLKLAADQARAESAESVGTEHLLSGLLTEGTNLALHVLRAMDLDPHQAAHDLTRHHPTSPPTTPSTTGTPSTTTGPSTTPSTATGPSTTGTPEAPRNFSGPAANALELAVTEATSLGHNYVGCEHLLLGLVTEPDGTAGQVLRALGADPRLTRRAVVAALAGYVHLRAESQSTPDPATALATAVTAQLQPLLQRIERLEERLGSET